MIDEWSVITREYDMCVIIFSCHRHLRAIQKREHILDYVIGTTSDAVSIPCTLYINLDFFALLHSKGECFSSSF